MRSLCMTCISNLYKVNSYVYFITIKPSPNKIFKMNMLLDYMLKRHIIYWLVQCKSIKGFIHYHGLLGFPLSQTPNKGLHGNLSKQINRYIGFVKCTPLSTSINVVYTYIRGITNTSENTFKQTDYYNNVFCEHADLVSPQEDVD